MVFKNYFKKSKFYMWRGKFAIVKSKKILPDAFAIIKDKNEITIVIDQSKIKNNKDIIEVNKNWKILTLGSALPLNAIGITAKISDILAKANISIFPISSYSRDHFLIKEKDLEKAKVALKNIGFIVK